MTPREGLSELAALYALDALEGDERSRVERAIATNAALRNEIDAYREVAGILAEAVEDAPSTPSPSVWDRIHAEVGGASGERKPQLASVTDIRTHRRWTRVAGLISAAAVVVSLALGARVVSLQDQIGEPTIEALASAAVTTTGTQLVSLQGAEDFEDASAVIALQPDGTGYLVSHTLPGTPADRTYQLWAVVGDGDDARVISAGVLGSNPDVLQFQAAGDVSAFAITVEPAGGVVVSEGPTVVAGAVDS